MNKEEAEPKLDEKDWPEIRRLKASNDSGWRYFEHLTKTVYRMVGEEKTCEILSEFMKGNADLFLKRGIGL